MDFALPPVGEGLLEVELVRWLVSPGDAVKRGQPLMEVMSDKATMEVPAAFTGTVSATLAEPGGKITVGQVVMRYDTGASAATAPAPVAATAAPVAAAKADVTAPAVGTLPPAAPSVRHMARKLGVDLARVRGSGPGGRVLIDDLAGALRPAAANGVPAAKPAPPAVDYGRPGTRTKLVGLRRKIAEHMVEAKRAIPHYAYVDECDLTDLVRMRGQLKESFYGQGVKLTYLPFIVKAVARALKEIPIVNSTLDEAANEIVLHDKYHVGIAVAAPNGLIVPVIHDADQKDVAAIASDIERLSGEARAGRAKLDDLKGGTFTVTSVGNIGGLISTPIINSPEVGIVGVGKVTKRPVYDAAGNVKPADIVFLSFSFDHRVLDGAIGAAFGNAVIRRLQNPAALLLPEPYGG
jgi:pyruvate dehydrogenase E2 component (dihydrolipoamide acetyltransferase)/2-oxoisovalerate dehydrogenase E2 component (dihydrolipoyl transacylase)